MDIETINIYEIALPFAGNFPHALNKGGYAKNVVCEIISKGGKLRGYGEGAPRAYVTGESTRSVLEDISRFVRFSAFPKVLQHIEQVWDFIDVLPEEKTHHSAVCALECALLDILGKGEGKNVSDYFSKDFFTEKIHYGAAIPLWNSNGVEALCRRIQNLEIRRLKLKMGKDVLQNQKNLETLRAVFKTDYDLKVDANGAWDKALALAHMPLFKPFQIRVIEQPMAPEDPTFLEIAERAAAMGIFLMADESVCQLQDVDAAAAQGFNMVNIRLSKCGGFRRSFKLVDLLREKNFCFQIGCHLGESGILSAAGRVLSLHCRDALYYDGSYDAFLLKENVTRHPVSFGKGGEAGLLPGPGLGVDVDLRQIQRLCESTSSIKLQ